jgi:hypothetical protein
MAVPRPWTLFLVVLLALVGFAAALVVLHRMGDRRGKGSTLGNLGIVSAAFGDKPWATAFCAQSLAIGRELR